VDLKTCMRVLINKVFNQMLKLHQFKVLMVQKTALNFRFLWLKNKTEINLFENLHRFKVTEASDLISWLDFLLDNLFLCFGQGVYRQCIGIPMVLIVQSIWLISISLPLSLITLSVS
jgi:hypothetical protein